MRKIISGFLVSLIICGNIQAANHTTPNPTLVIEQGDTHTLEEGTRLVVLDKLHMKQGTTLKILTGVNDIKFQIKELIVEEDTTIDSVNISSIQNGADGNNASG